MVDEEQLARLLRQKQLKEELEKLRQEQLEEELKKLRQEQLEEKLEKLRQEQCNEQLARLLYGSIKEWNKWRKENEGVRVNFSNATLSNANLRGANLKEANLKEANFREVNLKEANLSDANLRGANLRGANLKEANFFNTNLKEANLFNANLKEANLSYADLSDADLTRADLGNANLSDADLSNTDLSNADLSGVNLSGVNLRKVTINEQTQLDQKWQLVWEILNQFATNRNLSSADLSNTDLGDADLSNTQLSNANLRGVNLTRTQALNTSFEGATLTGACIQDWNINNKTNLNGVICEYVYLGCKVRNNKLIYVDRRPHDPDRIFAPGEFSRLFQIVQDSLSLYFKDGVNWDAFLQSFQGVQIESNTGEIAIQAIEKKRDGSFVVKVDVPEDVDKGKIRASFERKYKQALKKIEARYRKELNAKDREIKIYKQQNVTMTDIIKVLASRPINVENKAVAESDSRPVNFQGQNYGSVAQSGGNQAIQGSAGQSGGSNTTNVNQSQDLASAAKEIQDLLEQLEERNPTATEPQKEAFVSAAIEPTKKQRLIGAVKSGGRKAIEAFFDNKFTETALAIVDGWSNP